jgi:primosomal protein N' (replication factor Y) (superfamily II helicase)
MENHLEKNIVRNPPLGVGGLYAEIIIPLALPKNYTWLIPDQILDAVKPGCRVEVNLGKNKKYAGIVKRIHNEKPEFFEPKEILNILDTEPVVYEEQL